MVCQSWAGPLGPVLSKLLMHQIYTANLSQRPEKWVCLCSNRVKSPWRRWETERQEKRNRIPPKMEEAQRNGAFGGSRSRSCSATEANKCRALNHFRSPQPSHPASSQPARVSFCGNSGLGGLEREWLWFPVLESPQS